MEIIPNVDLRSPFRVLSLCTGVGGLDLGLRLAVPDARTICMVEREAYCCEVLASRMEEKLLDPAPIWTDVQTFDGQPWRGVVDCVVGGYPCQGFSIIGKRLGDKDPRYIWPDIARIVSEVQPRWCFFENVGNHLRMGFEQVHDDLQRMGYRVAAGLFTASEVGDSQKRERLFILAHADSVGGTKRWRQDDQFQRKGAGPQDEDNEFCEQMASADGQRRGDSSGQAEQQRGRLASNGPEDLSSQQGWQSQQPDGNAGTTDDCLDFPPGPDELDDWQRIIRRRPDLKPSLCRMADGSPNRVDRLRACGNGVVPLAAAYAFCTLRDALADVYELRRENEAA